MEARVEYNSTPDSAPLSATALHFPANDDGDAASSQIQSPSKLPRRLRRRLLESKSPFPTAEDIETKLRDAQLRRQQFYDLLSSKARLKLRSPTRSSSRNEGLCQRLEAKLKAAEQKRLSILAKVQKRLSSLDEQRQAARNGVELRLEKERDELGVKVQSRTQQAEANRLLLSRACRQRRMAKKEKMAQLLAKRVIQESRHRECVWAAIHRKRAAAEKKRLGLLEAKKSGVRARALLVQRAAKSVYSKRENERRRLKDQLEDRLQKAKRLRTEYLKKKASLLSSARASLEVVDHENIFSSKIARSWKRFVREKGTTFSLAKSLAALGINETSVKLMPFEQLAAQIESGATIQIAKALLDRLQSHITIRQEVVGANTYSLENIDHLLKHLTSPAKRVNIHKTTKDGGAKEVGSEVGQVPLQLSRYPVRVVLCAYMILGHPDAVFSGKGEYETSLAKSAKIFIQEFELLTRIIMERPIMSLKEQTVSSHQSQLSFRSQLESFDNAWCSYLYSFVMWKVKDAKLLEEDLVRAAGQLEVKMMQTGQYSSEEDSDNTGPNLKGFQEKVVQNQKLLQSNTPQLSALSSVTTFSLEDGTEGNQRVGHKQTADELSASDEVGAVTFGKTTNSHLNWGAMCGMDNEVLVNEIVHGHKIGFIDGLSIASENQERVKAVVRNTMEKAFWDGVFESLKQHEPDYSWVLKLMKEVQDELCEISPASWGQEINETIDIDILSEDLKSGRIDMDDLRRILEFALNIIQKLSAPANENELKTTHQKFLEELNEISQTGDRYNASFAPLVIEGLRFVLKQIQTLKHDINKARFSLLGPLIKGPAGIEYLRNAFAKRYGAPIEAPASLPLVLQWLSAVKVDSDKEWSDYLASVSGLPPQGLPPATLRAGGSVLKAATVGGSVSKTAGVKLSECTGEKVDLYLRLGLLRLVSEVEGLALEKLPETLKLNLSRLRAVQSKLQKVIVICSSILVLRQTLLSDQLVTSSIDMENIMSRCINRLLELLDSSEDVEISDIIEMMNCSFESDDLDKCQSRKEVMANMLVKSLRTGDAIFAHVSRTVYLAAKGFVLGGSEAKGSQLAEAALKCIGASLLTDNLVEAVEELVIMANVSVTVHRPWYEELLKSLE